MSFPGERIKKLRWFRGYTCEQLARLVKRTRPYLSSVENGHNPPTPKLLEDLADPLGVDVAWFTDEHPSPAPLGGAGIRPLLLALRDFHRRSGRAKARRRIPLLAPTCAADPVSLFTGRAPRGAIEKYVACPDELTEAQVVAVRIAGDRMAPRLFDGDLVLAVAGAPPREDRLAVARADGEPIACGLYRATKEGVTLTPINARYPANLYRAGAILWAARAHTIYADAYG
ncbi:MAG: helix-turn-helix domain-containing protein [Planctomycetes bacterium]|nr:helix-turn-helix domain-containing protein [Planctomycetota bacterium]